MAGFFRNLMDSLKLQDEEESYDEYEKLDVDQGKRAVGSDRVVPEAKLSDKRSAQANDSLQVKKAHTTSNYGTSTYIEKRNDSKTLRMERPAGSKVVPIKTTRQGLEVCVMRPRNFEESQDICDVLLSECCAIVNLEDNDLAVSRRIMDFIYGVVYSINGKLIQISDLIFIVTPGNVDVSGDCNDILAQTGYENPIRSKVN